MTGAPDGSASVVPLPPEPEPDPAPDERPSGPWDGTTEPPPLPADRPPLEPVGEVVMLDDASDSGGPPELVWNGSGWGVVWPGTFRALDEDGRPIGARTRLARASWALGLDFAAGRYAVIFDSGLAVLDRNGTFAAGWADGPPGHSPDVTRMQSGHQWIVAIGDDGSEGEMDNVLVYAVDDALERRGDVLTIPRQGRGDVRLAGAKSRALLAWATSDGVSAQSLSGPELQLDGSPFPVFNIPQHSDSGIEVELFRDLVAVAAMDGSHAHLALVDPWTHAVVGGPIRVGDSNISDRRPGIAVANERGFLVVCYAVGPGPFGGGFGSMDGVALQVVGADGSLWGPPVPVVSGERNIGGVDCGWNGRDVVVAWWRAAGDGAWNSIFSQRVRPTFL